MQCRKAEISAALEAERVTGSLRVRAECIGGRTAITDTYRTAPFHLGQLGDRDELTGAELIVQGVGPGYLPGDRVEIDISCGRDAKLLVRDQGHSSSSHLLLANPHIPRSSYELKQIAS